MLDSTRRISKTLTAERRHFICASFSLLTSSKERERGLKLVRSHFTFIAGRRFKNKLFSPQNDGMSASINMVILCLAATNAVRVPFLPNTTLVPISTSSSVTLTNMTCDQCLCHSKAAHMILNCFPNATCQFFVDAPRTYELRPALDTFVYFPRQIVPNASESCTQSIRFLLDRLNETTPTYAHISSPRCLLLDNQGYLVTVSQFDKSIVRFHPNDLTRIDQPPSPIFSQNPRSLSHHNGAYFVGFYDYILVLDSSYMSQIASISTSSLLGTRDMIFLSDGQQMIVISTDNGRLLFFNRSSALSYDYDFIGYQTVSCQFPYGLLSVNDTFFYLTSRLDDAIYSYSSMGSTTSWTEMLVLDASSYASLFNGFHVSIDNSGRYWFSLGSSGAKIFDNQGAFLGTVQPAGSFVFDAVIMDNYVIYFSDTALGRIIRMEPNLEC